MGTGEGVGTGEEEERVQFLEAGSGRDLTREVRALLRGLAPGGIHVVTPVFHAIPQGVVSMCRAFDVPYLGEIPMHPALSRAGEEGRPVGKKGAVGQALNRLVERLATHVQLQFPLPP